MYHAPHHAPESTTYRVKNQDTSFRRQMYLNYTMHETHLLLGIPHNGTPSFVVRLTAVTHKTLQTLSLTAGVGLLENVERDDFT